LEEVRLEVRRLEEVHPLEEDRPSEVLNRHLEEPFLDHLLVDPCLVDPCLVEPFLLDLVLKAVYFLGIV
jgi:hypothetical protein